MSKKTRYLVLFILTLILLSPLGTLAGGSAWGEWEADKFKEIAGFIPQSIEKTKPLVEAAVPDYEIKGLNPVFSSVISGLLGTILLLVVLFGIKKTTKKDSEKVEKSEKDICVQIKE